MLDDTKAFDLDELQNGITISILAQWAHIEMICIIIACFIRSKRSCRR